MMKRHIFTLYMLLILSLSTFAQNGIIKGKVIDATNNEPLPFVNVIITGTTIGVVCDDGGNFTFADLKPGYISLTASFVGYETTTSRDIFISNAKTAFVEIALNQSNKQIEEVVVKTKLFKKTEESPLSLKTIGLAEIESNPGSNRDISKVIQSFPGVGTSTIARNDIIIRGGGPSESRFFLDGVEIPYLNHFSTQGASGGSVGIVNADFISGVNFYSGAFPANRGNALSGVFEFTQINGNREKVKLKGSVGASEISLTTDGPLGEKSDFIFSVRRSYLQLLFSAIGLPFLPTFNDYQIKYRYKMNRKNEFTLISIGALDQFRLNKGIKNPTPDQEYILTNIPVYEQWSYTIGGVYKHYNEKSNKTIVLSRNMLNNSIYKYPENDESKPRSLDYISQEMENKFRFEISQRVNNYKFIYGISSEWAKYTNTTSRLVSINGNNMLFAYDSKLDILKYGTFFQASAKYLDERLTLSAGLRIDGNTYSKSMQNALNQLSPRISASYQLSEKFSINANTGRYFQLPAYTTLGYEDTSGILKNKKNNISYITVNHAIAGLEYRATDNMQFTIEGFYKMYENYPVSVIDSVSLATKGSDYGVFGDEEVVSTGKGRAYGIEFMNRTRLKSINSTNSLTIVRSEFLSKGVYVPTTWDSKYIFTTTNSMKLKRNWNIGFKWRLVGGLPYTPYNLQLSSNKNIWTVNNGPLKDMSKINSLRFSPFHQLDIRVDKQYFFPKWSFMFYIDIQNLYNNKSESEDIIIREKDDKGNFILTDNGKDYVLESYPNTSGTVLPTIGLIVEF